MPLFNLKSEFQPAGDQPKAIEALTHNRESALCLAVMHHHLPVVKLLVEKYRANVNELGNNDVPLIYTVLYQGAFDIAPQRPAQL